MPFAIKRHFWTALATFSSVVAAAYLYTLYTPPVHQASTRIMLDQRRVSVSELGQNLTRLPDNVPGGPSPIATQAEVVKSQKVLQRALDQVALQGADPKRLPTVTDLAKALKIKLVPATNIIEISYQDSDGKQVAQLLNAIADVMVQESAEAIRLEASTVRKFLDEKVPQQQSRLAFLEKQEALFRESNGLIDSPEQTRSLVASLSTVEDQMRQIASQLNEANTKRSILSGVTGYSAPREAYAAAKLGNDEELKKLKDRLTEAQAKVIDGQARLGDQHPDLLAAIEQRDKIDALYKARLAQVTQGEPQIAPGHEAGDAVSLGLVNQFISAELDRNGMASRLQVLQNDRVRLAARIASLPAAQQGLAAIVRQKDEAARGLQLLQTKLDEARIAEAQLVSNVRIIDRAEAGTLASIVSTKPLILASAIAAGIILSVGLVLLSEAMDNTIRNGAEAEAALQLPVLGILPRVPQVRNLEQFENFLFTPAQVEPYRVLLKTLDFRANNQLKVLLVSSPAGAEGTSNLVARLAAIAAKEARRTLIIDADGHQPIQHQFFDLPGQPALTTVTQDQKPLANVVEKTGVDRLSVVTHQATSARGSVFLDPAALRTMLEDAAAQYDLVIVDTSMVQGYADVMTISQYADGILLAVRPNATTKTSAQRAIAELQKSSTPILGIVMNATPDPHVKQSPKSPPTKDFTAQSVPT
jgi:capsular exopolysaccharide synthesis family protein